MRRRAMNLGPTNVWTNRTTSADIFHPATSARSIQGVKEVRVGFEMNETTGDVTGRPAVRYSDDGDAWDATATNIGTATLTANGVSPAGAFITLPGTVKTYAQFGYNVRNTAQNGLELARMAMLLETRT